MPDYRGRDFKGSRQSLFQKFIMLEGGDSGSHMEGPHNVEEGGIWINLGNKREQDIQFEMLKIMKSLRDDL